MYVRYQHQGITYGSDLSAGVDISIPLRNGAENPNCFWAPIPEFSPVVAGDFVGSTAQGGVVNFFNVKINPHGNGTHTECVGHIARERYVLRECLREHHFIALLISVYPRKTEDGDRVIFRDQLEELMGDEIVEAVIVRTLPNDPLKMRTNWSGSNPPYFHHEALAFMAERGVQHLLTDLPSVDREEDGGQLLGHRAFWRYPHATRTHCSITEMVYVPDLNSDGLYLLNIQTTSLDLDASPSRPYLFRMDRELR